MELGKLIRAARHAKGLTQAELGKRFGISKAAVAMWEAGTNMPDPRKFAELVRVLGLNPLAALGGMASRPALSIADPGDAEMTEDERRMVKELYDTLLHIHLHNPTAHEYEITDGMIFTRVFMSPNRYRFLPMLLDKAKKEFPLLPLASP